MFIHEEMTTLSIQVRRIRPFGQQNLAISRVCACLVLEQLCPAGPLSWQYGGINDDI